MWISKTSLPQGASIASRARGLQKKSGGDCFPRGMEMPGGWTVSPVLCYGATQGSRTVGPSRPAVPSPQHHRRRIYRQGSGFLPWPAVTLAPQGEKDRRDETVEAPPLRRRPPGLESLTVQVPTRRPVLNAIRVPVVVLLPRKLRALRRKSRGLTSSTRVFRMASWTRRSGPLRWCSSATA